MSTPAAAASNPGILLDVDGTLVDSNYLHTLAWSRALQDAGEWAPMNAIHRLVGMGGDNLLGELLGHGSSAAEAARSRHYQELIGEVHPFPAARDLLLRLHADGLRVVLASSAPEDEVDTMIDLLDVRDVLDAATSSSDADASKPAPDIFRAALSAGNVDRERALVVGDSVWDVRAARAAGIGCIGVETGGFSAHELREEGALSVYRDVSELLDQLLTSPIGGLLVR